MRYSYLIIFTFVLFDSSPCRFPSPRDVNFELKNDEERETMKRFQNHIDRNENKDVTLESIGLDHINVNNDLVTVRRIFLIKKNLQ